MTQPTTISQAGIDLIKRFEGLKLTAYRCPAGVPTIGYGHTRTARMGQAITEATAEALLREDLAEYEQCVTRLVHAPLDQHQFDALVSFAFNIGCPRLSASTLLTKLNRLDYAGAADELLRWNRGGGKVLRGLVRRREAERALFLGNHQPQG